MRSTSPGTWARRALLALVFVVMCLPAAASALDRSSAASPAAASDATPDKLGAGKAVVLGVVEGLTEYLPVSSTGHLVLAERALSISTKGVNKDPINSYTIIIQFGAILAVLFIYWQRVWQVMQGLFGKDKEGRSLLICLVAAFIPAAVIGKALGSKIEDHLLSPGPVAIAWIVGGAVLLAAGPWRKRRSEGDEHTGKALTAITPKQALVIGFAQALALWPGTSRSLVTILAALAVGLSLSAAVEFSFLLGLMTLGAATIYEAGVHGSKLKDAYGLGAPAIGILFAAVFAAISVKFMVTYLQRHDLAIFGYYRLAIGAITVALIAAGTL